MAAQRTLIRGGPEGLDCDRLPGGALTSFVDPPEAAFAQLGKDLVPTVEDRADRLHVGLAPQAPTIESGFYSSQGVL
jgi:hypothetical protein